MAMPRDTIESSGFVAAPTDTLQDSITISTDTIPLSRTQAKKGKSQKDEVDKENLGYKIGYLIGSWLIPGILMILVTVMIFMRARKGKDQNPGL